MTTSTVLALSTSARENNVQIKLGLNANELRGVLALRFQFPDSAESGFLGWGRSKRVSAMTHKRIALEFVVPTVLAIALGIVLSIGAVYLIDNYLPIDQAEAHYPIAGRR
jgi:hypothetical protein